MGGTERGMKLEGWRETGKETGRQKSGCNMLTGDFSFFKKQEVRN